HQFTRAPKPLRRRKATIGPQCAPGAAPWATLRASRPQEFFRPRCNASAQFGQYMGGPVVYTGYFGFLHAGKPVVLRIDGSKARPLPWPQVAIDGGMSFQWGQPSPGSHLLSLALLGDALRQPELAIDGYHQFTEEVVAKLPTPWNMALASVLCWYANRMRFELGPRVLPEVIESNGRSF